MAALSSPVDFPVRENFCRCFVQCSAEHVFVSVLFTDQARFDREVIINIHNQHQWAEEKILVA
jgi:hypothetical protein